MPNWIKDRNQNWQHENISIKRIHGVVWHWEGLSPVFKSATHFFQSKVCIYIIIYIYPYSYQTCKLIRVPYESNNGCHVSKKRVQKTVSCFKICNSPNFFLAQPTHSHVLSHGVFHAWTASCEFGTFCLCGHVWEVKWIWTKFLAADEIVGKRLQVLRCFLFPISSHELT